MTNGEQVRVDTMGAVYRTRVRLGIPEFSAMSQIFLVTPLQFLEAGANVSNRETNGSVSEWLMETDCKSVG